MTGRRSWLAYSLLSLAAAFAAACGAPQDDSEIEFKPPVRVAEVGTGEVEDLVVATGTLRAPETAVLSVETAGILEIAKKPNGRRFSEGDFVRGGTTVAYIRGEEVKVNARREANERRYAAAKQDYDAKKRLFEEGLIGEIELVQAESSLADARAELERSEFTESQTELVSPISGVIQKMTRDEQGRPIAGGQRVTPGFVVAEVAPAGRLVADIDLIGADASRVEVGMPVRVRFHSWKDRTYDGRVTRYAPTVDPTTRAFRVEVEVTNKDRQLRPGMFVEATVLVERRDDVPVIPRSALTERGGKKVVFVIKGQRVEQRDVDLGLGTDEEVEIREGLAPGEKVVVRGLETLADGVQVRVLGS